MPDRLLILTTDLRLGGTPTVVRELTLRLRARGHDVHAACLAGPGEISRQLTAAGAPVHTLGARSPRDLTVLWQLRRLIRDQGYSHVYSLLVHANAAAAFACRALPSVALFQSIQTTQPDPAWHWRVQRYAARSARRIIVPTASVATAATERSDIPASNITVIPNAIDAAAFDSLASQRAQPDPSAARRIVFLGRLDPVKRIDDLIRAVAQLPPDPAPSLLIFGDGPDRPRLESVLATLPAAAARTRFMGPAASAADALAQAGVLVLPSLAEGFGLVLIEAMAAGVPVVASDAPGIRDVVTHDHDGLLFPIGDVPALARALTAVLTDPALRSRLVAAGRETVRRRFDWPTVLRQYEATFGLPVRS